MAGRRTDDGRLEFASIVLVNTLPIAGVVWLDWEFFTLYLFYWLDISALIVVYGVCALFSQRRIVTEGRNFTLVGVSSDTGDDLETDRNDGGRTITIHSSLPPLYSRNVGFVLGNVGFLLAMSGIIGFTIVEDFIGWEQAWAELTSTVVLPAVVAVVGSHVGHAYRTYFRRDRYEDVSAHMVLEVPGRIVFFLLCAVPVWILTTALLTLFVQEAISEAISPWFGFTLLVGIWVLIRTIIDWGRLRTQRLEDPGRPASWFAPEDPRANE